MTGIGSSRDGCWGATRACAKIWSVQVSAFGGDPRTSVFVAPVLDDRFQADGKLVRLGDPAAAAFLELFEIDLATIRDVVHEIAVLMNASFWPRVLSSGVKYSGQVGCRLTGDRCALRALLDTFSMQAIGS